MQKGFFWKLAPMIFSGRVVVEHGVGDRLGPAERVEDVARHQRGDGVAGAGDHVERAEARVGEVALVVGHVQAGELDVLDPRQLDATARRTRCRRLPRRWSSCRRRRRRRRTGWWRRHRAARRRPGPPRARNRRRVIMSGNLTSECPPGPHRAVLSERTGPRFRAGGFPSVACSSTECERPQQLVEAGRPRNPRETRRPYRRRPMTTRRAVRPGGRHARWTRRSRSWRATATPAWWPAGRASCPCSWPGPCARRSLVDVNEVGLDGVAVDHAGPRPAASAPPSATARSSGRPAIAAAAPLLAAAAAWVGHPAVRHRGTLGGSLAHADPAAELPAAVVALGGSTSCVAGPSGTRRLAAADAGHRGRSPPPWPPTSWSSR